MKKLFFLVLSALSLSVFADSQWSEKFNFEGNIIDPDYIAILHPTDEITVSAATTEGIAQLITVSATSLSNLDVTATIFQDDSENIPDQTFAWDFKAPEYADFVLGEDYLLSETIVTDKETQRISRTVNLMPEPAFFFIVVASLLFFRRHMKKFLLLLFAVISLNANATNLVQNVKGLQFWPFEGTVIINYTLNAPEGNTFPVYKVKFFGSYDGGKTEFDLSENGTVEQDGADEILVGEGDYKAIWKPDASLKNINTSEMQIKVEAEDITDQSTYLVLDLKTYKLRNTNIGPMEDPEILSNNVCKTDELWLRRIEPGTFIMGSPNTELFRNYLKETQHEVTLTKAFYTAVFETTQKQYKNIMGFCNVGGDYGGDTKGMLGCEYDSLRGDNEGFTWPRYTDHRVDEDSFFGKLRALTGNKLVFDLPTEAQWEYACRAGTTTSWNDGTDVTFSVEDETLDRLGWYQHNLPHYDNGYLIYDLLLEVGQKIPNAWGLYDMHGNLWELCLDWYEHSGQDSLPISDPVGTANNGSGYRVWRGGDYWSGRQYCRSGCRSGQPDVIYSASFYYKGFRLVLVPKGIVEEKREEPPAKRVFKYTIAASTKQTLPVFTTKFYAKTPDGSEYPLEDIAKLEGAGASGIVLEMGNHKLTWYPKKEFADIADDLELRVEYLKVTDSARYLVLNLKTNKMRCSSSGPDLSNDKCRTEELWFRRIEPGTFTMGSHVEESGHGTDEYLHDVTISSAFYIGVFETTYYQYVKILGGASNYVANYGDTCAAANITYNNLRGFESGAAWPSIHAVDDDSFFGFLRKRAGNVFDLPTEAQWEYACRAGTTSSLNDGTTIEHSDNLDRLGWWRNNSNEGIHVVGQKVPNKWGLYDMHGNVSEWCRDWYAEYPHGSVTNWIGPTVGQNPDGADYISARVLRGGSYRSYSESCRSACRAGSPPDSMSGYVGGMATGFRIAIVSGSLEAEEFEYSIDAGNENSVFVVNFYGRTQDGAEYSLKDLGKLSGEGAVGLVFGNGKHKIVWSPSAIYRPFANQFDLRVEFEDVTEQAKYLVVDLKSKQVRCSNDGPDITSDKCRTDEVWFRRIEPGKFIMGSPQEELNGVIYESPQREVTLTKAYYLGVFEMTQKQSKIIVGNDEEFNWLKVGYRIIPFEGDGLPMYFYIRQLREAITDPPNPYAFEISWPQRDDHKVGASSLFGRLKSITKFGFKFDLPTEAQWEYACRAGTTTAWNNGTTITNFITDGNLNILGCYHTNKYVKVGSYLPNAWGLYDMHGNVGEWCLDKWYYGYPNISPITDPLGTAYGYDGTVRGGSFGSNAAECRSGSRAAHNGGTEGFRAVIVP